MLDRANFSLEHRCFKQQSKQNGVAIPQHALSMHCISGMAWSFVLFPSPLVPFPTHKGHLAAKDWQSLPTSSLSTVGSDHRCLVCAGGRNVTVGLRSHSGYFRRTSVVALAIFSQYWYWYPLSYFLTLTLQPTALLGLNAELQMPKLQVAQLSLAHAVSCIAHLQSLSLWK